MYASRTPLLAVAAAIAAAGILSATVLAAESAAEIPKDSYYNDPLTATERSGIAQEENVSPSDGRASVPNASDDGVIPDAAIDQGSNAKLEDAASAKSGPKRGEDEADVVLDDAKKNDKVTKRGLGDCMKDWDPQTQMSKEEWKESCRTTLEYFPDGR
jgi:hypothetical protein